MVTKQSRSTPVMQTVLDAVIERLDHGDESLIRIPEICEATGVNYGSVYHHFGSREGVIDAAYEWMFIGLVNEDIAAIRNISETASTLKEYVEAMQPLLVALAAGEERSSRRARRVRIVAAAITRPELRKLVGKIQSDLTADLTELVQHGQDQGWIRSDIPANAIAVFFLALVFGRNLDDVSVDPIPQADWDVMILKMFTVLLARG